MKNSGSEKEKLLIIINGKGGVGKDTLCDFAAAHYPVRNVSSITPIKEIAAANGWNGEKTPEARRFLADLKEAFTRYNDLPTRYLLEQYREFLDSQERIMFAHIREAGEIEKLPVLPFWCAGAVRCLRNGEMRQTMRRKTIPMILYMRTAFP